jgi:ABC-type multidrug transport system permease subunit
LWNLTLKNIKEIVRDKKILYVSILLPGVFLLLSHFVLNHWQNSFRNIPLAVVNPEPDYPAAGNLLTEGLKKIVSAQSNLPFFHIQVMKEKKAFNELHKNKVAGILVIPKGFTHGLNHGNRTEKILFMENPKETAGRISAVVLAGFIQKFSFLIAESKKEISHEPVELTIVGKKGEGLSTDSQILLIFIIFSTLYLILFSGARWVSEFESGAFYRFKLAGIPPLKLLAGSFLSSLFLGVCQMASLLIFARLIGINPSLLILWIWPVILFLALAAEGIGLVLSSYLDKEKQLNLASSFIFLPLYLLSFPMGNKGALSFISQWTPWHEGYVISFHLLHSKLPDLWDWLRIIIASCALALVGTAVFSMRRLRHE